MFFHMVFLMCFCVNHNYSAYIHAMNEEEYQIISSLKKDGGRFLMSLQERTKAHKTAYVKYSKLKEKLSIDKKDYYNLKESNEEWGDKIVHEKDLFKEQACVVLRKLELGH